MSKKIVSLRLVAEHYLVIQCHRRTDINMWPAGTRTNQRNMVLDTLYSMDCSTDAAIRMREMKVWVSNQDAHICWAYRQARWVFEWEGGLDRILDLRKVCVPHDFCVGGYTTAVDDLVPENVHSEIQKMILRG